MNRTHQLKRKSVLISHPWMGSGGSEMTTMWAVRALQDDFLVSLVTAADVDLDELNQRYQAGVDSDKVNLIRAPRLPFITSGAELVALQHSVFQRFCRSISHEYDLCISGYNFTAFGKPSIQLIGDFSFSEELRQRFYAESRRRRHQNTAIRRLYLSTARMVNPGLSNLPQTEDMVLANSNWSAKQLKDLCHVSPCGVLYPPVLLPNGASQSRTRHNQLGFLYLGRVSPEKELETIIDILDRVRTVCRLDVKLDIGGNRYRSCYERSMARLVERYSWINDLGYCTGPDKRSALERNAFGIQACRSEAFGIAAAEMASLGCLPFVPKDCGPSEIVPFPELQFNTVNEAVGKISSLLQNRDHSQVLRERAKLTTQRFSCDVFLNDLMNFVEMALDRFQSDSPLKNLGPRSLEETALSG